ncbi:MAG: hypothetical protein AABY22_23400 [Nanoarchaeota archaeon]
MFKFISNFFKKEEKVEVLDTRAIIKMNDVAKENSIFDDENKIIELHRNGKIEIIKYSDADVQSLREQGIPVLSEEYSDNYDFINAVDFGAVESWRKI